MLSCIRQCFGYVMLFLLLCSSSCPHLYLGYFVAVYYSEFGSANRRVLMQLSTRPLANASKSCYIRRLPEGQCNVVTSMKSTRQAMFEYPLKAPRVVTMRALFSRVQHLPMAATRVTSWPSCRDTLYAHMGPRDESKRLNCHLVRKR